MLIFDVMYRIRFHHVIVKQKLYTPNFIHAIFKEDMKKGFVYFSAYSFVSENTEISLINFSTVSTHKQTSTVYLILFGTGSAQTLLHKELFSS